MPDNRLVVADFDPQSADYKRLRGLSPGQATGIGLPAFKIGQTTPQSGDIIGEAFFNMVTRSALIWDGQAWSPMSEASVTYPTDADLLADPAADGTVAVAINTGNLYTRAGGSWRLLGAQVYATEGALLAATPGDGTVAVAQDTSTVWARVNADWLTMTPRRFDTTAAMNLWKPSADYAEAFVAEVEQKFVWNGTSWRPLGVQVVDDMAALQQVAPVPGHVVIDAANDMPAYVNNAGDWRGMQISHFATEAAMLGLVVPDGVLAWAGNTGNLYARVGGDWHMLSSNVQIIKYATEATLLAATLPEDTLALAADTNKLFVRAGGAWAPLGSGGTAAGGATGGAAPAASIMFPGQSDYMAKALHVSIPTANPDILFVEYASFFLHEKTVGSTIKDILIADYFGKETDHRPDGTFVQEPPRPPHGYTKVPGGTHTQHIADPADAEFQDIKDAVERYYTEFTTKFSAELQTEYGAVPPAPNWGGADVTVYVNEYASGGRSVVIGFYKTAAFPSLPPGTVLDAVFIIDAIRP